MEKFYSNSKILIAKVIDEGYVIQEDIEAREEAKNRLKFFKHIIEECDGYLALYYNGKQIAKEKIFKDYLGLYGMELRIR